MDPLLFEIRYWVRRDGETALHPSCSAKMGPASDPMAVVDPLTMKVHGMENQLHVNFPYRGLSLLTGQLLPLDLKQDPF
jgi:hypothetical protein